MSLLSYVNYASLPSLGICHIVLANLVGRFWRMMLGKHGKQRRADGWLSAVARKRMTERGKELVLPTGT